MITAFPPQILLCLDEKYGQPKAFLHEDAMQLMVDRLEESDPEGNWGMHDIAEDYTVRANLIRSENGEKAVYQAKKKDQTLLHVTIGQFDRSGKALVEELIERPLS